MYKFHRRCRACGYGPPANAGDIKAGEPPQKLQSILNLGVMPLPNAFKKAGEPMPGHYPVELLACPRCHLGQLSAVVDPKVMYADYPYVTSPSETMKEHFDRLWTSLNWDKKVETIVEIGSNDGLCLEHFKKLGAERVMGIDPAENLAQISRGRGIDTITSLFDRDAAEMASAAMPPIDLVLARHVFCHIDDWVEFVNNIGVMCSKDTLVCVEVPHAHDTIAKCEWDTIYAEHLSYLTILSMKFLLEGTGFLRLHNVVRFPVHGGAIALMLRRRDSTFKCSDSVEEFLKNEHCNLQDWKAFAVKAQDQITNLKLLVRELRNQGKRVVGYGASAKSTVWINACGFTKQDIEGVYDYTPQKWYTNIPGTDIPVKHEGAFFADCADYAVVWCWNFLDEILVRQKKWSSGGGKFILPVPEVKIL